MTTNSTGTRSDAASGFVADTLKQTSFQVLGALSQATKMTLGTVSTFIRPFSKGMPSRSAALAPSRDRLLEWLDVSFETLEQVLKLQHELLHEVIDRFAGAEAP